MIKNKFTLKQLEAFVYVADFGTFRKAATALGTTQPNVSVRIAALEETLGVVLMHRDAGSVRVTEKGQEVLAASREVLRATEALLEVADRRDLVSERLRLGVTELVASTWLHKFLRAFRKIYPNVRVELTVDLSVEIENHLSAGQLDLALQTEPFRTKMSGSVALGSHDYGWVTTPKMAAGLDGVCDIADVFERGILTHGKHTLASVSLRRHVEEQGLRSDAITHSSSLTSTLHMAVDGMGVALLPRQLYAEQVARGQLVEVKCTWMTEPLRFFARYDAARAPLFTAQAAALSAGIAQDDS
jgi:DNA-binding transcriptional LysR family regulator